MIMKNNKKENLELICDVCKIKLEKTIDKIEVFEGTGIYEEGEVYKCPICGEVLLSSDQIDSFQYKHKEIKVKGKIVNIGGTLSLQIPRGIQEYYGLKENTIVELIPVNREKLMVGIA